MGVVAFERVPTMAPRPDISAPAMGPTSAPRRLTDVLFLVAEDLRLTDKDLAFHLGYTERYVRKIRSGEKELQFERIAQFPPAVRRALWGQLATGEGLRVASDDRRPAKIGQLLAALGEAWDELEQLHLPMSPAPGRRTVRRR